MDDQYNQKKQFLVKALHLFLLVAIGYALLRFVAPFLSPFIAAFLIAYGLKKPVDAVTAATRLPRKLVAVFSVIVFYSTVGVLVTWVGLRAISLISGIVSALPSVYQNHIINFLFSFFEGVEAMVIRLDPALVEVFNKGVNQLLQSMGNIVTSVSISLFRMFTGLATLLPYFFFRILLMVISTFFMTMDFERLMSFAQHQFSERGKQILKTTEQFVVKKLFLVIRSYALIMSVTFVELAIGLTLMRVPNAILIAMAIALFDIFPALGTGGILLPWSIVSLLEGNYRMAIGLLVLYAVVTSVRFFIEPRFVGEGLKVHPLVVLISMVTGVSLFGVLGLFGFPILISLLKHLNDTGTYKLFK